MTTHQGRTGILDWTEEGGGSSPPLVMIHALGADRQIWASQLPALSPTRRVILLDLPGHGASSAAPGPYTIADLGRDVIDVAAAAGAVEFDVCGISLGGLIALWLAASAPDRILGLIASNTAARIGSEEFWSARIEAVETGGMEGIRETAVARFFTPAVDPATVETAARALVATDPAGYVGCCVALRDADLRQPIEAIRCQTLVIGADQDISTPPEDSVWLHEHIPGSRLHILEGAAHFSNLERPDAWTAAAVGFLSER